MNLAPLTGTIGAEMTDVDLNDSSTELITRLETELCRHQVLCVRGQTMTPADLMRLTERLGGPGQTPYLTGLADYPDVVPVVKEAHESSPHTFGAGWHTDFTFQQQPPSYTLLYAVDTPAAGGDTLYASLSSAWNRLSPGLQSLLLSLRAIHSATRSYGPSATLKDHLEHMTINNDTEEPDVTAHPIARVHPITMQPALWINPTYTIRFENMTEAESKPLLNYLNELAVSPGNCCRVRWQPGTLTIWDNRCTQHCATSDYQGYRREMWRTTVAGETPIAYRG